jgi:hypothetical protein
VQARRFSQALTAGRPEQTGRSAAAILDMQALDWGANDRAIFSQICVPIMERYGYALDETYRVAEGPHRWLTSVHRQRETPSLAS